MGKPIQEKPGSLVTSSIDNAPDASHRIDKLEANPESETTSNDGSKPNTSEESEDDDTSPAAQMPRAKIILIMASLMLAIFVVSMDNFIIAPALPIIAAELGANNASYAWIESSLLLSCTVAVPIFGRGSDFLGRRLVIVCANAFFFVGTLIGGLACSTAMLLAGRVLQGIGCGGLLVVVNICVADLFTGRKRAVYFSVVGALTAVATAAGPCIGGALTGGASWRWCFWINLPLAGISFFFLIIFLNLPRQKRTLRQVLQELDWLGLFLIVTATVLFLVGLQLGGVQYPWSSAIVISLIAFGAVLFLVFGFAEALLIRKPLIPFHIFGSRSRVAILSVMVAQSMATVGGKLFLPLYFQLVLGVSPLMSAVYFLPFSLTISIILPLIGWLIKRRGKYRSILIIGSCILTIGAGLLVNSKAQTDWAMIVVPQVLLAVGQGFTYQLPLIAFQALLTKEDIAAGQSAYSFLRTFSQMVGVIIGQVIFQAQIQARAPDASALIGGAQDGGGGGALGQAVLDQLTSGSSVAAVSAIQGLAPAQQDAVHGLLATAFNDMWIFFAAVAFVGFGGSLLVRDVDMDSG